MIAQTPVNSTNFTPAERLESLKAGTLAATVAGCTVLLFSLGHRLLGLWPAESLTILAIKGISSLLSGFLFGVTYRYIIRRDRNPQLKAGAVFAFGFIRTLAQLEGLFSQEFRQNWLEIAIQSGESFAFFAIVAGFLEVAFQKSWIQPFNSD